MVTPRTLDQGLLAVVLLVAVTLFAFWPVLEGEFLQWDDPSTISQNPDLNPPGLSKTLGFWDWTRPRMDLYVPLTYTVWAALAAVARAHQGLEVEGAATLDPKVFHAASLGLHVLSAVLVLLLLRSVLQRSGLTRKRALWPAAIGSAFYALHPLQVEAVAWASGLKDVLSGSLCLLAIVLYLAWSGRRGTFGATSHAPLRPVPGISERDPDRDGSADIPVGSRSPESHAGLKSLFRDVAADIGRSRGLFAVATLAFLLAVLAKPSAIVAPLVAGVLAAAFYGAGFRRPGSSLTPTAHGPAPNTGDGKAHWRKDGGRGPKEQGEPQRSQARSADVDRDSQTVTAASAGVGLGDRPIDRDPAVPAVRAPGGGERRLSALPLRVRPLLPLLIWVALSLPLLVVARRAQPADWGFRSPLWSRPLVALDALAFYAFKLVLPLDLGLDYGRSPDWLVTSPQLWLTWLVPVALGALVWMLRRRAPWLAAAGLVFVLALLPVLGLVRFDFQRHSTVADHYVYVAMLGPALALAFLAALRSAREQAAMGLLLLAPLAVLTRLQTASWHDTVSVMTRSLAANPSSIAAHINLGHIAYVQRRTDEAILHYEAALAVRPDDLKAHNNLGNALVRMNRPTEALQHYRVTLEGQPDNPGIHFNIGNALGQLGRLDEAIREYLESLRLRPDVAQVHVNLASVYLRAGRAPEAAEHYRQALRLEPDAADAKQGLARAEAALAAH